MWANARPLEKIGKSPPEVWIAASGVTGRVDEAAHAALTEELLAGTKGRLRQPPSMAQDINKPADGDRADQRLCRGESRRDRTFGTGEFGARGGGSRPWNAGLSLPRQNGFKD